MLSKYSTASCEMYPKIPLAINLNGKLSHLNFCEKSWILWGISVSLVIFSDEISPFGISIVSVPFFNSKEAIGLQHIYEKFLFSGTDVENKINIIFEDSVNFDESKYLNKFDLIFIDGGHTYSVVKNDTEKSFKMLNKNGIILWHDYVPGKQSAKNVVNYLNEISKEKKILNIRNTSLCVFRNSD